MDNASLILQTLDNYLDHPVRLILYGRAALNLGFNDTPPLVAESKDVDVIIALGDLNSFSERDQFWDAQEATNEKLRQRGLYITHLFREDQVFLRRGWEEHMVRISRPATKSLRLFRPATLDLILTKMMRGNDAQDMADIAFMIRHDRITKGQIEAAFRDVVIPDIVDLRDAFKTAQPIVRKLVNDAGL